MLYQEQWFHLCNNGTACTVFLDGELDISQADELAALLEAARRLAGLREMRVDLSWVTFIDVRVAGVLLAGATHAQEAGIGYALEGMHRSVERVLRLVAPGGPLLPFE